MTPNIPAKDNHTNLMTGQNRTWRYGERKVVVLKKGEKGVIVGIEPTTNEGYIFVGEGHDVVRVEYDRAYILEFRRGGVNDGYWAIACELPPPAPLETVNYGGKDRSFIAMLKDLALLADGVVSPKVGDDYFEETRAYQRVPWNHCIPQTKLHLLQQRAALALLNRRLRSQYQARIVEDRLEVCCGDTTERSIFLVQYPDAKVLRLAEEILALFGLPTNLPDLPR